MNRFIPALVLLLAPLAACQDATQPQDAENGSELSQPSAVMAGGHHYRVITLASLGGMYTVARSINDNGQIAGGSMTPAGDIHAVVWTRNGRIHDLGALDGTSSGAEAINNSGEVVGTYGSQCQSAGRGLTSLGDEARPDKCGRVRNRQRESHRARRVRFHEEGYGGE